MENRNSNSAPVPEALSADRSLLPFFTATLFPYRSLSKSGFRYVMLVLATITLPVGLMLVAIGAWPAAGCLSLTGLGLYVAFKINYRAARMYEVVTISRSQMRVRKCAANGNCVTHVFNPAWTRFCIKRHDVIGIVKMEIASRGKRLSIGDFLNPEDRNSFAREFGLALASAKR